MKKLFLLFLLAFVFVMAACDEGTPEHTHSYKTEWSSDADYHWHEANCEHTTEVSDKAQHNWTKVSDVPASCTEDGSTSYRCSCGREKTETVTSPGHTQNTEYAYDEVTHWIPCDNCSIKQAEEPHKGQQTYVVSNGVVSVSIDCDCGANSSMELDKEKFYHVSTENDLRMLLTNGYNTKVTADINLTASIRLEGNVTATVDLNGHTVKVNWVDTESYAEVFGCYNGATLTILGDGVVDGGSGSMYNGAISTNNGTINIISGYFKAGLAIQDGEETGTSLVYARTNGVINIYGGTFEAHPFEGVYYTLDILESELATENAGKINVYGGSFVNFDPANHTNDGTDYKNKLASNEYHSVCTITGEKMVYNVGKHEYSSMVTQPGCESVGYTTHTCSECGNAYTSDETQATGHNHVPTVKDPTCTTDGYTTYTCDKCNDTYTADEVPSPGHNYDAVVTPETCTTDGYTTHTCTVCNDTYTSNTVAAHHNYEHTVVAPKCEEDGYTLHTCSVCGDEYTDTTTQKTGHTVVANYVLGTGHCSVCEKNDIELDSSDVYTLPGSFNSWDIAGAKMYVAGENLLRVDYELSAGEYEFKVGTEHDWAKTSYGNTNYYINGFTRFDVANGVQLKSGSSNGNVKLKVYNTQVYTFLFNTSTKKIVVYCEGYDLAVAGAMNNENWGTNHQMEYQGNGVYTLTLNVTTTGTKEFKVKLFDSWDLAFGKNLGSSNNSYNFRTAGDYVFTVDFYKWTVTVAPKTSN